MASGYLSFVRALLASALPLFLSMIAGMVSALVVTGLLGHEGSAELTAFALSSAVLSPAMAAVLGSMRGMVPFVAPHRERPAEAMPILRDARWLALCAGGVGAVLVGVLPPLLAPEEVPFGALPLLLAVTLLVAALGGGANSVLIALGRSRQVLWSALSSTVVEVVLLVVLVPVMGPSGAGVAMVVWATVSVVVSSVCLLRVPGLAGQSLWPGRPRPAQILRLARVGVPLAGTTMIKFTVLGVVTYAAASTGSRDAAAHAVLTSLIGFLFLAALSVAQASMPEIARAATTAAVRKVNRDALALAAMGVAIGGLVVWFAGGGLLGLFTSDPAVSALAVSLIPLLIVSSVADACQAVMGFGLAGLKRSSWSLGSLAIGYGLLALAAFPVAATWGLTGLWVALAANNLLLIALQGGGFLRHSARVQLQKVLQ